jgi:glycosyltransferase involved in cell wall biosynthesis
VIALLGRRDAPTDALEDYCTFLGRVLSRRGCELEIRRVGWMEQGWSRALADLERAASRWRGQWVLVQYTALSWSKRGFPRSYLRVMRLLRKSGTRTAVVFHDVQPYGGARLVDRLRRRAQLRVMRAAYDQAERSILTVPLELVKWLPADLHKATFIPVGANVPELPAAGRHAAAGDRAAKTIAVFGVTGGQAMQREVADIAGALNQIAPCVPGLKLALFGRNSKEAVPRLKAELNGARVQVEAHGLLAADEIPQILAAADLLLHVRGHVSSRRGSALAGIACGVPVVGYRGDETSAPITEAGVLLVPQGDRAALADAMHRVLEDPALREDLAARSRAAQQKYFSWDAIAGRLLEVLGG